MNAFIYLTPTVKTGRKHTASGGRGGRKEVGKPAEQMTAWVAGTGRWQEKAQGPGHPVLEQTPSRHLN